MTRINRLLPLVLLFACLFALSGNALTFDATLKPQEETDPYEEYLAILSETELPSDFVTYEQISCLGELRSFKLQTHSLTGKLNGYCYYLQDYTGKQFCIMIRHGEVQYYNTTLVPLTVGDDLRTCEDEGTGMIRIGEISYLYGYGKLEMLGFEHGDLSVILSNSTRYFDYPIAETLVSDLLHRDTAAEALRCIRSQLGETPKQRFVRITVTCAVLLLALVSLS